MKSFTLLSSFLAILSLATLISCTPEAKKSAEVSSSIRMALDNAGLKDVSVNQNREKGVVTLGGQVTVDTDKAQAATIAKNLAGEQVISNEIAIVPKDNAADAKKMNNELDKGIESNLEAALIKAKLNDVVKYSVSNHVVTLTGEVKTLAVRTQSEKLAAAVPNVQQVVNELQLMKRKATSSN